MELARLLLSVQPGRKERGNESLCWWKWKYGQDLLITCRLHHYMLFYNICSSLILVNLEEFRFSVLRSSVQPGRKHWVALSLSHSQTTHSAKFIVYMSPRPLAVVLYHLRASYNINRATCPTLSTKIGENLAYFDFLSLKFINQRPTYLGKVSGLTPSVPEYSPKTSARCLVHK